MIGAVLVTHGRLGQELLNVATKIVGELDHIRAVSIGWHDDVEASKRLIQEAVDSVDQGKGVIILTDMFGGTPSNISLSLLAKDELEIVTGVNLPMVVKLASQTEGESLEGISNKIRDQGKNQISVASQLLGE